MSVKQWGQGGEERDKNISLRVNTEATVEGVSPLVKALLSAEEHFKAKLPLPEILQLSWSRYFEMSFKL